MRPFGSVLDPFWAPRWTPVVWNFHNETKQLRLFLNQVKYESRERVTYSKIPMFKGMRQCMNPDQSERV